MECGGSCTNWRTSVGSEGNVNIQVAGSWDWWDEIYGDWKIKVWGNNSTLFWGTETRGGVGTGILLNKEVSDTLLSWEPLSERITIARLQSMFLDNNAWCRFMLWQIQPMMKRRLFHRLRVVQTDSRHQYLFSCLYTDTVTDHAWTSLHKLEVIPFLRGRADVDI